MAIRKRFLYGEPLCRKCSEHGIVRIATQVDHIVALVIGGSDDDSNKQPICDECHKVKTANDLRLASKKVRIGLDGWPVD